MQNMTEISAQIKVSLLDQTGELADCIIKALNEGTSAYDVEKDLWSKVMEIGRNMMGMFFKSCGDGDEDRP